MAGNTETTGSAGMLITALVLGIVGGVFGIISAVLALMLGGMAAAFSAEGSGTVAGLGFAAIFIGILGIIGGALARGASKTSALLLLISGVAGFIALSMFWLVAGPLLIVGAVLAWFGRKKHVVASHAPAV